VRCVPIGQCWCDRLVSSEQPTANFRRFWADFYSAASFLLRLFIAQITTQVCSASPSPPPIFTAANHSTRAVRHLSPPHPVVCVSSLSHIKEVCVPSHNPTDATLHVSHLIRTLAAGNKMNEERGGGGAYSKWRVETRAMLLMRVAEVITHKKQPLTQLNTTDLQH